MNIGFDFDGTLTNPIFGSLIKSVSSALNKNNLILITSRSKIDEEVISKTKSLDLNIKKFFAMGETIHLHKADFVKESNIKLDIFFDNDPYDVEAFRRIGVLCLFIAPEVDSLMEEIYESFLVERCRDLNSYGINDIIGLTDGID